MDYTYNMDLSQPNGPLDAYLFEETKRRADSLERKLIAAVNERETLKEHLRQAYVVSEALNEKLALLTMEP